ncbi:MAG: AAA family ATPase [Bacteroidales bacterium]|jgi:predicted AAA+ superfamily ATPase|nr:AAA family ATPase [Bacteroidales bacterium]
MNTIFETSARSVGMVSEIHIRPQIEWLKQDERLIGIKGSRGVGKTTLLLQYAKTILKRESYVYVSLDNLYFTENSLLSFADSFSKNGGKHLLIDEVHHYPRWSQELKNIYDSIPDLKVVYTGSSLLHLTAGRADLSRRGVTYNLPGLSLREFINITDNRNFPVVTLDAILSSHQTIGQDIWKEIKPIKWLNLYLEYGYYPFFLEGTDNYLRKLNEVILAVLETDLPFTAGISVSNIHKIKQLLFIISGRAPFTPNIDKLSERIGISRNTLKDYLRYMGEANLISLLYSDKKDIGLLTKPDKIYIQNPNLMYALAGTRPDQENLRETFFLSHLEPYHSVHYPKQGDFLVDNRYTFEVGGRSKTRKQIAGIPDSFLVVDGIETGYRNEIPLWLFGFLY